MRIRANLQYRIDASLLLGYVNAGHLAIAIRLVEETPLLKLLIRDDVPRAVLIEAAIEVVAGTVEASP